MGRPTAFRVAIPSLFRSFPTLGSSSQSLMAFGRNPFSVQVFSDCLFFNQSGHPLSVSQSLLCSGLFRHDGLYRVHQRRAYVAIPSLFRSFPTYPFEPKRLNNWPLSQSLLCSGLFRLVKKFNIASLASLSQSLLCSGLFRLHPFNLNKFQYIATPFPQTSPIFFPKK